MTGDKPLDIGARRLGVRDREYRTAVQYFGTHQIVEIYALCGGQVNSGVQPVLTSGTAWSWYELPTVPMDTNENGPWTEVQGPFQVGCEV